MIEREIARRSSLDSQRALITLRIEQVRDWIALYKALGGGWEAGNGDVASNSTGGQK